MKLLDKLLYKLGYVPTEHITKLKKDHHDLVKHIENISFKSIEETKKSIADITKSWQRVVLQKHHARAGFLISIPIDYRLLYTMKELDNKGIEHIADIVSMQVKQEIVRCRFFELPRE